MANVIWIFKIWNVAFRCSSKINKKFREIDSWVAGPFFFSPTFCVKTASLLDIKTLVLFPTICTMRETMVKRYRDMGTLVCIVCSNRSSDGPNMFVFIFSMFVPSLKLCFCSSKSMCQGIWILFCTIVGQNSSIHYYSKFLILNLWKFLSVQS